MSKRRTQMGPWSELHDTMVSEEQPYTEVEIKVARLSIEGLTDTEIAGVLDITSKAVRALKEIITAKARAVNRGC